MKFDDSEYWKNVFGCEEKQVNPAILKAAHKLANKCRDKEIDRSWERGKYFWAFILASYTAHFSIYGMIFYGDKFTKSCSTVTGYLGVLKQTPYFIKLSLLITSFLALFFCVSWVLINKGSKFWQKNWEAHVDMLEEGVSGALYKTYLNTEDETEFSSCICNLRAYDYSVSKITLFGSIVLTFISFLVFGFNCALCIPCFEHILNKMEESCYLQSTISVFIIVILFVILLLLLLKCKGNPLNEKEKKWFQRKS